MKLKSLFNNTTTNPSNIFLFTCNSESLESSHCTGNAAEEQRPLQSKNHRRGCLAVRKPSSTGVMTTTFLYKSERIMSGVKDLLLVTNLQRASPALLDY